MALRLSPPSWTCKGVDTNAKSIFWLHIDGAAQGRGMKRAFLIVILMLVLVAVLRDSGGGRPARASVQTLDRPVLVSASTGKVEVIEFFHFGCRHCRTLEPALAAWRARQGSQIIFRRVPVVPAPQLIGHAKLFHALVALREEVLIPAVFAEIHTSGNHLLTREEQVSFVAARGVDSARFVEALDSRSTLAALQADRRLWEACGVKAVPMLVVQGKYSPEPGGDPAEIVKTLDRLVDQSRRDDTHDIPVSVAQPPHTSG